MGALALVEALTLMEETGLTPKPQDHARATYAPKLTREEEKLDWKQPAEELARKIRAFDPRPGAWAECRGKPLKLFGARAVEAAGAPGAVLEAGDTLLIACGAGAVEIAEVQAAGRARMTVRAFVNGRGVAAGDALG